MYKRQVAAGLHGDLRSTPVALEHHVRPLRSYHHFAVDAAGKLAILVVEDADIEVLLVDDPRGVGLVRHSGGLPRHQAGLGLSLIHIFPCGRRG